ncbi:hypothetical protein theurythT_30670 [Thalassotalea eurytherma]|uniref:Uncharacterized protein n=1 Tax=Thalassotalea eurytherma TaxID=1144278 RepID=A0ABQ6H823_9GAMM|nr:hypothetical protein theurythT_30670 [Thalassotalea eurytherma]
MMSLSTFMQGQINSIRLSPTKDLTIIHAVNDFSMKL